MSSFETSVKLLYERVIIAVTALCILLSVVYTLSQSDEALPNVILSLMGVVSLVLSKRGREKIAYHMTLIVVLVLIIVFFFTVHSQVYNIIMIGSTLTIYSLVFFESRKIQVAYLIIIILVEILLFHQAMQEDGLNLSRVFWPECITGVFHISVVYLFGYYFMVRLRQSNLEIDLAKDEIVRQNKDLSRQEKHLQQYMESNISLENFTSLASHELKSPMRIIKSFADLISQRGDDLSLEQIKDYLKMISANSERMSNLVDSLHDLSSVSQSNLNKVLFKIEPFIESTLSEEVRQYDETKISLQFDIERVYGDAELLRRLFSNLISNALKFSASEPNPVVKIHCFDRRTYFCFRISDNGIGIADNKREEVFELFNRQTNYSDYKGLGIGLALSKKIVDMHSGTIHILNSDLGGVCVEVRLPLS